jgi:hypothetical protein
MMANKANSKMSSDNRQCFMEAHITSSEITSWDCPLSIKVYCGAKALLHPESSPPYQSREAVYFSFGCLDRTATFDVTCCPFSIPPAITRPSDITSSPR